MEIWIFGNKDLKEDAGPVNLMPELQQRFPHHRFIHVDPHDERAPQNNCTIIDTVQGIANVRAFNSLDDFQKSPRVTLHDFDAYDHLRLLQKIGAIKKITIIGIPPGYDKKRAIEKISTILL